MYLLTCQQQHHQVLLISPKLSIYASQQPELKSFLIACLVFVALFVFVFVVLIALVIPVILCVILVLVAVVVVID